MKGKFSVFDCTIVQLDKHYSDRKGNLTVIENGETLPFDVSVFIIFMMFLGAKVGEPMLIKNWNNLSLLQAVRLRWYWMTEKCKRSFFLNRLYQGLYIKPGMWRDLSYFSSGAIAMVLASELYDPNDYIRNYEEFLEFRKDS